MRRAVLAILLAGLAGCTPTAEQQAAALTPTAASQRAKALQSRRFDTVDKKIMLQATVAALQDLGFTIDETKAEYGVVVASKIAEARIRAQIVVRPLGDQQAIMVQATFQSITPRPGAMLAVGQELNDPLLYRDFFEKLAQSAFLTAHEV